MVMPYAIVPKFMCQNIKYNTRYDSLSIALTYMSNQSKVDEVSANVGGGAGTVKFKTKTKPKLAYRGVHCMCILHVEPENRKGTYYSRCHLDETDDVHKMSRRASH
jgi:hypothetical protein